MKKTILKVASFVMMLAMVVTALVIPNAETKAATTDYYLIGYINGANRGTDSDWENVTDWKFENGTLIATFTADSYIGVKTGDNSKWYWSESYVGSGTTATFYNGKNYGEKALVKANIEYKFTLVENTADDSVTVTWEPTATATGPYYVTGDFNEWAATDDYKMTESGSDFVFTKKLAAGKYSYQISNGKSDNDAEKYPSDVYAFEVTEECDVTFKLTSKLEPSVSGDKVYKSLYVRGSMTGDNWAVNEDYRMSKTENGYTWTGVLEAGSYEFKVADNTWGEGYPSSNIALTLEADSTVTIVIDKDNNVTHTEVPVDTGSDDDTNNDDTNNDDTNNDDTNNDDTNNDDANKDDENKDDENKDDENKDDADDKEDNKSDYTPVYTAATIAGDFSKLTGANITSSWDVKNTAANMKHLGNGIYEFELTFDKTTEEITVNYKVAFNNAWDVAIGYDYTNKAFTTAGGSENLFITIPAGATSVKIYADENGLVAYNTIQNPDEVGELLAIAKKGDNNMMPVFFLLLAGAALVTVGFVSKKKFA